MILKFGFKNQSMTVSRRHGNNVNVRMDYPLKLLEFVKIIVENHRFYHLIELIQSEKLK